MVCCVDYWLSSVSSNAEQWMLVGTLFIYILYFTRVCWWNKTFVSSSFGGFGPSPILFYWIHMGVPHFVTKHKIWIVYLWALLCIKKTGQRHPHFNFFGKISLTVDILWCHFDVAYSLLSSSSFSGVISPFVTRKCTFPQKITPAPRNQKTALTQLAYRP